MPVSKPSADGEGGDAAAQATSGVVPKLKPKPKAIPAPKGFPAPGRGLGGKLPPKKKRPPQRKPRPPAPTVADAGHKISGQDTVAAPMSAVDDAAIEKAKAEKAAAAKAEAAKVDEAAAKAEAPPEDAEASAPATIREAPAVSGSIPAPAVTEATPGLGASSTEAALMSELGSGPAAEEPPPPADEPDELAGEPTSVTASPEPLDEVATDMVEAPAPLAEEPTRPHVDPEQVGVAPTVEAQAPVLPTAQPPSDGEFKVGPTVVVDPAALQQQQQAISDSYRIQTESAEGPVPDPIAGVPTHVGEPELPKSNTGLVVGAVLGALLLLTGLGVGVYFLVFAGEGGDDPVAVDDTDDTSTDTDETPDEDPVDDDTTDEPVVEGDTPVVEPVAGAMEVTEPGGDEPTEADPDPEPVEADPEPTEEEPAAADPGPTGQVDLATLEGAEADMPSTNRRARRMDDDERRRSASRLRGQALQRYRAEEWTEAERLYREALTFNDWDVAAIQGVARSLARQERYPLALAFANLAAERNPRSAAAIRVIGDIYRQAGHPEQALRTYRRGLRRHPDDRHLRSRVRELRQELR